MAFPRPENQPPPGHSLKMPLCIDFRDVRWWATAAKGMGPRRLPVRRAGGELTAFSTVMGSDILLLPNESEQEGDQGQPEGAEQEEDDHALHDPAPERARLGRQLFPGVVEVIIRDRGRPRLRQ